MRNWMIKCKLSSCGGLQRLYAHSIILLYFAIICWCYCNIFKSPIGTAIYQEISQLQLLISQSSKRKMEDAELAAIRARRLAELQTQRGEAPGTSGFPNIPSGSSKEDDEEKRSQAEETRRTLLVQILTPEARERLSRISLTKPTKSRAVEDLLIRTAQSGGIRQQVSEQQLIGLLEQVNAEERAATGGGRIVYNRRTFDDDDDEDLLL